MRLALIAAIASNRVIGRGGTLPWNIPEDLRRFKHLTTGRTVLMGRKTYASLGVIDACGYPEGLLISPDQISALAVCWMDNNLTEIDVVNVREQHPVSVSLDALPGKSFRGIATGVSQNYSVRQGDIVYEATILLIDVDPDELMERLVGRLTCEGCGTLYNAYANPPTVDGVCDRCGGRVSRRPDDYEETIGNRLRIFESQTAATARMMEPWPESLPVCGYGRRCRGHKRRSSLAGLPCFYLRRFPPRR